MNKKIDSWTGCYPSNWKGLITDESFAHPAKYSNKLIRRIYEHMFAEGWLKPGMTVVDPFGGVALGAFDACRLGLNWRGVELEPRFVKWGNGNIELWNKKFSGMPRWSTDAVLLRGDSRFLAQVLSEAQGCVSSPPFSDTLSLDVVDKDERRKFARKNGISNAANISPIDMEKVGKRSQENYSGVVSSPPYADGSQHTGGDDKHPERMGGGEYFGVGLNGVVSSPPYAETGVGEFKNKRKKFVAWIKRELEIKGYIEFRGKKYTEAEWRALNYGRLDGRVMKGAPKMGTEGYSSVVSSPPYADSINSDNGIDMSKTSPGGPNSQGNQPSRYGTGSAQLGAMKATDRGFDAAVGSPPFENSLATNVHTIRNIPGIEKHSHRKQGQVFSSEIKQEYGDTEGNLGSELGNDFWLSARAIIEQVYLVLEPGAHAVWVVKNYVKNKQIVPFCEQWQQMCEAVGFVTLHEHHAMLVRSNGKSIDLEGNVREHIVESKSFFRRIAEKKGSPKIDFETVLCMEKPHEA